MRVTDEMIEAGCIAVCRCSGMAWSDLPDEQRDVGKSSMRAALEAALSHAAGQEAVAWILQTGHGTGLHEGARPPVENVGWRPLVYAAAPPITSAEVGQDGEQCRAASDEVEALERNLVDAMATIHRLDQARQRWIDRAVKMRRAYKEQRDLLRALSRGVPEGM